MGECTIRATIVYDPIEVVLVYFSPGYAVPLKFFLIPHPEAEQ